MKVILDVDESYFGALVVSAVKSDSLGTRISATTLDLSRGDFWKLGADGRWVQDEAVSEA